ncbi:MULTISPECIES: MFS transporter [unclassified Streptomyces]|uniref:MFS transporter n=1 Tax=unclassified Streptomyces TaxID=2593676 RepID=UPI0037AD659D
MFAGTDQASPPAVRGRRDAVPPRSAPAFALLAAVQVVLILAITMLSVALPRIQHELGLSPAELTLVSATYGLSFSGLLLLGGRAADLYGQRRTFLWGTGVFAVASVAAGLAPDTVTLLAGRFAQGVGAAFAAPAAMALAGSLFPEPARRGRAMAVWGGLAPLGATLGTLASGALTTWISWRWTFAVPAVVAAAAVLVAPRLLPRSQAAATGRVDVVGAVLATAGLSVLSYGLVHAAEAPWTSATVTVPGIAGILLLAGFLVVERRAADPLLPLGFLASGPRAGALIAVLVGSAGIATMFFLLSLHFQQISGLSPLLTSAAFLPFSAVLVATGMLAARLVKRFGPRTAVTAGLLIAAAGLLLLGRTTADSPYAGALLGGLLLFPAGISLVFSGATVAVVENVPDDRAGLAGGLVNTALETGPTVGLAILVSLAASHTGATSGLDEAARAGATAGGYAFAFNSAAAGFAVCALLTAVTLRTRTSGD